MSLLTLIVSPGWNILPADSSPLTTQSEAGGLLGYPDLTLHDPTFWPGDGTRCKARKDVIKINLRNIYMWAPNFMVIYPRWCAAAREVSEVISIPSLQYIPCGYSSLMGTTVRFAFETAKLWLQIHRQRNDNNNSRKICPVLADLFFISPPKVQASLFHSESSDTLTGCESGLTQTVSRGEWRWGVSQNRCDTVPKLIPNY